MACFIAFSIITTLSAKDQENPNCCSSNTWVGGCWGEGTAYGDPFVLIRAVFKPGEVGMSWLGGHAKHSLPSVGQQDLLEPPHSSACNTSHALETSQGLHQPQQWSFCGRRWSGRKEKVWVSSPETPVEQQSLRWLELWGHVMASSSSRSPRATRVLTTTLASPLLSSRASESNGWLHHTNRKTSS